MKNIETKYIIELSKEVEKYKKLMSIYNHIKTIWDREDDYTDSYNLYKVLDNEIQESIDGINQWIGDLFYDWAGFRWNKEKTFSSRNEYWAWVDSERDKYESIDGCCEYIIGINNYVYSEIKYLPKIFIKNFISEYGLFELNENGDVWVK